MEEESDKQYIDYESGQVIEFQIPKKEWVGLKIIGKGAYGCVASFKLNTDNGIEAAVKKIQNPFETSTRAKNLYRELLILNFLHHPNVVELIEIRGPEKEDYKDIYIIMDKLDHDLFELIKDNSKILNEKNTKLILYRILTGIFYLHSSNIIHRDIKPSNILYEIKDKKLRIRICDFGQARVIKNADNSGDDEDKEHLTAETGTLSYCAPELLLVNKNKRKIFYNEKIDMWSFGCVMYELLNKLKKPVFQSKNGEIGQIEKIFGILGKPSAEEIESFMGTEHKKQMKKLNNKNYPKIDFNDYFKKNCPNVTNLDAIDLLSHLLVINPNKRYTALEALKHKYFEEVRKEKDLIIDKDNTLEFSLEEEIAKMDDENKFTFDEQITFYKNKIKILTKKFKEKLAKIEKELKPVNVDSP